MTRGRLGFLLVALTAVAGVAAAGWSASGRQPDRIDVGQADSTDGGAGVEDGPVMVLGLPEGSADLTLIAFEVEAVDGLLADVRGRLVSYGPPDDPGLERIVVELGREPLLPAAEPLSPWDDIVLAEAGVVSPHPALLTWSSGGEPTNVAWFGATPTADDGRAVARAVIESLADDPAAAILGPEDLPLPAGWVEHARTSELVLEGSRPHLGYIDQADTVVELVAYPGELPLTAFDTSWHSDPVTVTRRLVEIRETTALVVTADRSQQAAPGGAGALTTVAWWEDGRTWVLARRSLTGSVAAAAALDLVDALVPIPVDDLLARAAESVAPTSDPADPDPVDDPSPTIVATTETAGPHALEAVAPTAPWSGRSLDAGTTSSVTGPATTDSATTGPPTTPPGSTTGRGDTATTTTPSAPTTDAARPDILPGVVAPQGTWVEDRVVVIDEGEIGGEGYSVGVYWSGWLGLCVGTNYGRSALEGGWPAACRDDPYVGGGGAPLPYHGRPGSSGSVAVVFTPATIDAATIAIDGVDHAATLHRTDAFPEFTFAVFALDGVTGDRADALDLPGQVRLWLDGRPVGFG